VATMLKKGKVMSIKEKVTVVQQIEKGDICQKFHTINSTIQTIWKNRTKMISAFNRMDQE
jgi:hypothetical protein